MIAIGKATYNVIYNGQIPDKKVVKSDVKLQKSKETYISSEKIDNKFVNYIRDVVPKTSYAQDYFYELSCESSKYVETVRQSQGYYGFDEIVEGAANAYATMYQEIVEGHRNGTREVYVLENTENGTRRLITLEEELEKLDKGFETLIKWDKMVAKSRMQCAIYKQNFEGVELDDVFETADINQACEYIEEIYLDISSSYQKEYSKNGNNINIKELVSSILQRNKGNLYHYCELLFRNISNPL